MREAVLSARTSVAVTMAQARQWFLSLKEHPERYQFATHEGFEFVQGDFGAVGARFKTRERFFLLQLDLLFELTAVRDQAFRFRVLKPGGGRIWGEFRLQAVDNDERTLLSLDIGSETRLGRAVLRFCPVAAAVRRQIAGEVEHIQSSMEATYGE